RRPSAQALAMISQFKEAQLRGLDPEDYDALRWDARVTKLEAPTPAASEIDQVHFDLALTICAMRFLSDLQVGRVNPQQFKFGLALGPGELDLADHLRSQLVDAPDVAAAILKVEPPYDGYRRAEAALPDYIRLSAQGDTARISAPQHSIHPGEPY